MPTKHLLVESLLLACLFGTTLSAQTFSEYVTPTPASAPQAITVGPDGALWFTEQGPNANGNFNIGQITTAGTITEFEIPSIILGGSPSPVVPQGIATGPDGALWFTTPYNSFIGRMTTAGKVTEYPIPSLSTSAYIAAGPDGKMWFTEASGTGGNASIGSITMSGVVKEYLLPSSASMPQSITAGPDGALWFTDTGTGEMGRITTSGTITEFPLPGNSTGGPAVPYFVTSGPDGALWYTDTSLVAIGRITTAGAVTTFTIPSGGSPYGITTGPDGALWFTEQFGAAGIGTVGRVSTSGSIAEYPVPTTVVNNANPTLIVTGPDQALWFTDNSNYSIGRVAPAFAVSCNFPANSEVGATYSASCAGASGNAPYTYSISAGSLPPGLSINASTGAITGSPTTAGTYSFTVQATDSSSPPASATFQEAALVVTVRTPVTLACNLNGGQVGIPYTGACTGSGGIPPYVYSISAGALPPGLTLNTTSGAVTGTPTTYGIYAFTVQVNDSGTPVGTATQPIATLPVAPPTLGINCNLSNTAELGIAYASTCTGTGGIPPYTFSITGGTLPLGLTLNAATGAIAGIPTVPGVSTFNVTVTDSGNPAQTANKNVAAFTVLSPNIGLLCNFSTPGVQGSAYSTTCAVSGGKSPYTFSLAAGSALPPGLAINATTGAVTGSPTAFGTYAFTLQVIDSSNPAKTSTQIVNGFMISPATVAITNRTLPNGFVNLPYSGNPLGAGGKAPYSWVVETGQLPVGLNLDATTGAITGTPTTVGAFAFTLQVTDASAHTASQAYSGTISAAVVPNYTEYPLPTSGGISSLVIGPDGALWFTAGDNSAGNVIGSIGTTGSMAGVFGPEYGSPNALGQTPGSGGINQGPDGALWFAESDGNRVGRITTAGQAFDFGVTTPSSAPQQIVTALDGALWFTEYGSGKIGRITSTDIVTEFPTLTKASGPLGITAATDGTLWFTESAANNIGQITTAGVVKEFAIPTAGSTPVDITTGPDGALWFTENAASKIGRISSSGQITEFPTLTAASSPVGIVAGPDGAMWFTESATNQIGRITTDGVVTEYAVPTAASGPQPITLAPDGNIWFGENSASKIAKFVFVPQLTLSCTTPAAVQVGGNFSSTCTASGGIQPYAYSISAGALPPGVMIDPVAGAITGSPSAPGTYAYTVQASDASVPVQNATQAFTATVAPLPLSVSCSAPSTATVGQPYTGSCVAANGTPPYAFSVSAGALPSGVTIDPVYGIISGTPLVPANYSFTILVVDSSSPPFAVSQNAAVAVTFGSTTGGGMPLFNLNGFPTSQNPATNATGLTVQLNQPAGFPITGSLALSFIPNASDLNLPASGTYMDPALQFVDNSGNGLGTTYNFTVPANATSIALPNIDSGTVAGGVTASLTMAGITETTQTYLIPALVPQIEAGSVQITNVTSTGFDVEVVANSSTRDLEYATFTFTGASGATIVGDTTFTVDVTTLMNGWFAGQDGLNYGSAFSLTVPFQLSGSMSAIQSVSVTLTNFTGTSAAVSGTK